MRQQSKMQYWSYHHQDGWSKREYPAIESYDAIEDFLEKLGYLPKCDYCFGDEFVFVEMFEHPIDDHYLFYICLNNYNKIIFSFNTPSALHLIAELKKLVE